MIKISTIPKKKNLWVFKLESLLFQLSEWWFIMENIWEASKEQIKVVRHLMIFQEFHTLKSKNQSIYKSPSKKEML